MPDLYMPGGHGRTPRLLVSVRSVEEARSAIAGGCDIIDVKEPAAGSLGRASDSIIAEICELAARRMPVSAAMGEVTEWPDSRAPHSNGTASATALQSLAFAKFGLAGLGHIPDWSSRWETAVRSFDDQFCSAETTAGSNCVAVIYADWESANAPPPDDVIDYATSSGNPFSQRFAGVLVDTFSKTSGHVLEHLSIDELSRISIAVQDSGRFFAVAGKLTVDLIQKIASVQPDIVAVRSAACRALDRTLDVDADSVRYLRAELQRVFAEPSGVDAPVTGARHGEF